MYQRIKNKLDMEIIKDFLESEQTNQNVVRRMEELTDILDGAYDGSRGAFDMGNFLRYLQTAIPPPVKALLHRLCIFRINQHKRIILLGFTSMTTVYEIAKTGKHTKSDKINRAAEPWKKKK